MRHYGCRDPRHPAVHAIAEQAAVPAIIGVKIVLHLLRNRAILPNIGAALDLRFRERKMNFPCFKISGDHSRRMDQYFALFQPSPSCFNDRPTYLPCGVIEQEVVDGPQAAVLGVEFEPLQRRQGVQDDPFLWLANTIRPWSDESRISRTSAHPMMSGIGTGTKPSETTLALGTDSRSRATSTIALKSAATSWRRRSASHRREGVQDLPRIPGLDRSAVDDADRLRGAAEACIQFDRKSRQINPLSEFLRGRVLDADP